MLHHLPFHRVPHAPRAWAGQQADPANWDWESVPALAPFVLADGSRPARQQTVTRFCYNAERLYVRFDCEDQDIWGAYTQRDDPIYDEEVVELFLSPGDTTPTRYYEFEVSPNGVLLDALITNPTSDWGDLKVDLSWNCPALHWQVGRDDALRHWWAILIIPWASVHTEDALPATWRANFYRIERPRDAEPEFSCWSPTMTQPPDFHKPAYFGTLQLLVATGS